MSQGKRRKWTAAEKLRIVMTGVQKEVDVAELCRREGINPTQFYGWKKQLLSSASKVFDDGRTKGLARSPTGGEDSAHGVCDRGDHGGKPGDLFHPQWHEPPSLAKAAASTTKRRVNGS